MKSTGMSVGLPAQPPAWKHGISILGGLKYPARFNRFEYVNASAPKAGVARQAALGSYDSFNPVIAGVKGNLVEGIELIFDTLMMPSLDEAASEYGLIAEAVSYPSDLSWVRFRLRAAARWHDGKPISPTDVIYSLNVFKRLHPQLAVYYRHVSRAEQTGDREVMFVFDKPLIRDLPYVIGQLTVLPQHWWEGKDKSGKQRDISQTTLEPPLGSGAYRIEAFEPDRFIVYKLVADYWARDLAVNRGANNIEELRFDYFLDSSVAFQAFQAGLVDWRTENSAKNWATGYGFPAVREERVVREEFAIRSLGTMQGFVFNTRRGKFQDPRVRRAFNFAFNFERVNQELFYGLYTRITSYFDGTELASSGLPEGRELELLQSVRSGVPPEVFTEPYWNPVSGDDEAFRSNLLEAMRLLNEAGFEVRDLVLVAPESNERVSVKFLIEDQSLERIILFYQPALQRLGINAVVRLVDDVQYNNRLRNWDFDIIVAVWQTTLTPGNEQQDYWGSSAADTPGSGNLIGIKNPAVDALIDRLILARDRDDLVAATRALDRVLLWNHYVVPHWNFEKLRTARWDKFGGPKDMPKYGMSAFPTLWWWDALRAAKSRGND
jgi:microcin C transport system substrate-binding protein